MGNSFGQFMTNNAGNIGSAVVSGLFNAHEANKTREWNSQEAAKNRMFQQDMWEQTNAYNSPANQMRLLKEAGLNPNAIYGQGTASAEATMAEGSAASSGAQGSMPMAQIFGAAQIKQMMAAADLAESQANKTDKETAWLDEVNSTNVENVHALTKQYMANTNKSFIECQKIALEANKVNVEIKKLNAEIAKLSKEGKKLDIETSHLDKMLDSVIKDNVASANLKGEQANLCKEQANEIKTLLQEKLRSLTSANDLLDQSWAFNEAMNPKLLEKMSADTFQVYSQIIQQFISGLTANMSGAMSIVGKIL